jgi:hypothetical protein
VDLVNVRRGWSACGRGCIGNSGDRAFCELGEERSLAGWDESAMVIWRDWGLVVFHHLSISVVVYVPLEGNAHSEVDAWKGGTGRNKGVDPQNCYTSVYPHLSTSIYSNRSPSLATSVIRHKL